MKYIKYLNIILLLIILYSTHTLVETIRIEKMLSDFKENANVEVYDLSEDIDFIFEQNDILLNRKSGHDNLILRDIITFYTGGHAALVTDEAGTKTIEVFGYKGYDTFVNEYDNDWITYEAEVIGLRTKPVTLDFTLFIGRGYDWFPYLPNKQKYCTELITDTYSMVGINLDYDYGIATVNDIILSSKTELYLYKEIKDGKVYIYWED